MSKVYYETKCRRCGTICMHPAPVKNAKDLLGTWGRMMWTVEKMLKEPGVENCPTCEKPTIHDIVAYSHANVKTELANKEQP